MSTNNFLFLIIFNVSESNLSQYRRTLNMYLEMLTLGGGESVEKFNLKSYRVVCRMMDSIALDSKD